MTYFIKLLHFPGASELMSLLHQSTDIFMCKCINGLVQVSTISNALAVETQQSCIMRSACIQNKMWQCKQNYLCDVWALSVNFYITPPYTIVVKAFMNITVADAICHQTTNICFHSQVPNHLVFLTTLTSSGQMLLLTKCFGNSKLCAEVTRETHLCYSAYTQL